MLGKMFVVCVLLIQASWAWSEEYRVDVNDQLNIRVAAWDAASGQIIEMPGLPGIYEIDSSGQVSIPLIGAVDVAGLTTSEVAAQLEAALVSYAHTSQSPQVAVTIEAYAPFYMTGQVVRPDMYEFTPGLTVFKAVALAGGLSATKPVEGEERNFLSARGAINMLQQELMFLTARRDRVTAEIDGADDLVVADQLAAWVTEAAILQSRNTRYARQLLSLETTQTSLREALSVLEKKLANGQIQLQAGEEELQRGEDLIERGLLAQTRGFAAASYVSELQTRILDIERSILQAQQELQGNERDAELLLATRHEDNAVALQQVNAAIAEVEAQIATQYSLLGASTGQQAGMGLLLDPGAALIVYEITRVAQGQPETFDADRNTAIQPGDLIEVIYTQPPTQSN